MSTEWYCRVAGTVHGPMTGHDLNRMAETGKLAATDEVRKGEHGKWVPAASVRGLNFRAHASLSSVTSTASGDTRTVPTSLPADAICPFCGSQEIIRSNELSRIRPLWKGYMLFGMMILSLVLLIVVPLFLAAEGYLVKLGIGKPESDKNFLLYLVLYGVVVAVPVVAIQSSLLASVLDINFIRGCRSCSKEWDVAFSFKVFWKAFFEQESKKS
jgi:GYF domain 2